MDSIEEKDILQILTEEEVFKYKMAFAIVDKDRNGFITTDDLEKVFEEIGMKHADQEGATYTANLVDSEHKGKVTFQDFLKFMAHKKQSQNDDGDDLDIIDAFVAMGGQADQGGSVDASTLIQTIKGDFEMTINIEELIRQVDTDGSGVIEFGEFKTLLSGTDGEIIYRNLVKYLGDTVLSKWDQEKYAGKTPRERERDYE